MKSEIERKEEKEKASGQRRLKIKQSVQHHSYNTEMRENVCVRCLKKSFKCLCQVFLKGGERLWSLSHQHGLAHLKQTLGHFLG